MKSLSITTNFGLSAAGENCLRCDTRRCSNNQVLFERERWYFTLCKSYLPCDSRTSSATIFLYRYNTGQRYIMEAMEVHPLSRRWPFLHRFWKMDATVLKQRHFHLANYPVDRRWEMNEKKNIKRSTRCHSECTCIGYTHYTRAVPMKLFSISTLSLPAICDYLCYNCTMARTIILKIEKMAIWPWNE